MVEDSLYVITPIEHFESKYVEYEAKGFVNRGSVRYSLDGTKVLIEESSSMFSDEDLALEGVLSFSESEIKIYLREHLDEWEEKQTAQDNL